MGGDGANDSVNNTGDNHNYAIVSHNLMSLTWAIYIDLGGKVLLFAPPRPSEERFPASLPRMFL